MVGEDKGQGWRGHGGQGDSGGTERGREGSGARGGEVPDVDKEDNLAKDKETFSC